MNKFCITSFDTGVPFYDSVGGQVYLDNGQLQPAFLDSCPSVFPSSFEWFVEFVLLFFLFFTVVKFIIKYFEKIL